MTSATRIAIAAVLLASAVAPLFAADMKGPCAADAQRFCQGVAHDRPHMLQCLSAHSEAVSPACKLSLQAAAGDRAARRKACEPDIQKLCKDAGHARGHFLKCLKAHESELSPACKSALTAHPGQEPRPTAVQ